MSPADLADPDRPRRLLEEVLSRGEFHDGGPEAGHWLTEFLGESIGVWVVFPGWFSPLVAVLFLVAATLLIVRARAGRGSRGASGRRVGRARFIVGAFLALSLAGFALKAMFATAPEGPWLSSGPRATRALSLWLHEFGYPTRSLRTPLTSIGPEQRCLFVLEPTEEITPEQARALFAWLEEGGTLFLAPGMDPTLESYLERWVVLGFDRTNASQVQGDRIVPDRGERWRYRKVRPGDRGMFSYPVNEVAFRSDARVRDPRGEHTILFPRDGDGLIAELFVGEGVLILFPATDFLTNRGLAKASNIELLASLIEDWIEPGTDVWVDEHVHGARGETGQSM